MKKYISIIFLLLTVVGCTSSHKNAKRQITVSIEPLRYFTEQIVGNKFKVNTMVPNGGNPETYEPTAQQMVDLSNSNLYIKVGHIGFERIWMKKLIQNAPRIIVVDTSIGINPCSSNHHPVDPHTWMSTTSALQIAKNIYKAILQIDVKDSAFYKRNLVQLIKKIELTDRRVRQQLTKCHPSSFLIYHPTLTYFARDYQLLQIPIEKDGREPSASQLQQIIQLARGKQVKTLFVQKEFAMRNTQIISSTLHISPVEINPLSYHWDEEMLYIAKKIR